MFCRYKDTEIREGSTVGNVVRKTTLSLAVALACVGSNWANALSLGEIRVLSHLAEPFRAEISLPIANAEELDELRVQLAPEQVFSLAGLDRAALVGTLNFSLQKRPDGSPYIWVQSNDAIKDLGLSFYVEARWRGGNIVRGYEVLLNPTPIRVIPRAVPSKAEPTPTAETVTPPVTQAHETARAEEPAVAPIQSELGPRPTRDSNRVSKPDDKGVKFGPTLPGDVLSDIARRIDPEVRYSRNLLMRAMLQQNPEAFTDGDPGKLKAGYTLHIADLSAVPALAGQAAAIPKKGGAPATRVRSAPASADAANSAAPPAPAKTRAVEPTAKPTPVKPLAIETPNNSDAQDSRATLEENLASTRNEVEVTKKNAQILQTQNDALRARIAELEKQVKQVAGTALAPMAPKSADEKTPTTATATANIVADATLVLPQAPSPVTVDTTPPIPPPPAKIEDFWIIFGAIAAITFLLLGFLGLRPEAREKIAEIWRTKIRREPTDHNVVHVD